MSFNSCIQQLFTGMASLIAGWVIVVQPDNKLLHYPWVGYISILVVLSCVFISSKIPGKSAPVVIAKEEAEREMVEV